MNLRPFFSTLLLVGALGAGAGAAPSSVRDGSHDFDFNLGVWRSHIKRVSDPFDGGTHFIELEGTVTVRKVWDGKAQLEEIEADGPNGHWEGLTLFLYNPKSAQWGQSYVGSKTGALEPTLIGEFKDGRGELIAQDTYNDRSVLVRATWSQIEPNSHHFEEAYSADGGKTWAPAFIADLTREAGKSADVSAAAPARAETASHEFDFDQGVWKTHTRRLSHPLSASSDWVELDGKTVVKPLWGGRANIAEYKAEGASGSIQLLALRWYNSSTRQWSVDFATPNVGVLGIPGVGEFKNGRCDFYDQETIDGRSILVRFSIWGTSPDSAQSEQAFSDDGGKTWEVNWINKYTRLKQ
jgi:hypothetical protein